jgi:hypothetical protein
VSGAPGSTGPTGATGAASTVVGPTGPTGAGWGQGYLQLSSTSFGYPVAPYPNPPTPIQFTLAPFLNDWSFSGGIQFSSPTTGIYRVSYRVGLRNNDSLSHPVNIFLAESGNTANYYIQSIGNVATPFLTLGVQNTYIDTSFLIDYNTANLPLTLYGTVTGAVSSNDIVVYPINTIAPATPFTNTYSAQLSINRVA